MKTLLDTDVLSQLIKPKPEPGVLEWFEKQTETDLFISVISIFEIRSGIEGMDAGKRRLAFEHWLSRDILSRFNGRIYALDAVATDTGGSLLGRARNSGSEPSPTDAMIAALAKVHGLRVATLNRKHFRHFGVELVDF